MAQEPIQTTARRTYQAYLLRLWQEDPDSRWRITLEDPHSADRRAFRDLEGFVEYLHVITGAERENDQKQEGAKR